jgi:hypothetical protein
MSESNLAMIADEVFIVGSYIDYYAELLKAVSREKRCMIREAISGP